MIFVTLGSQKFQFDRLLKKLDELVEEGVIREEITAQIGASTYLPKHFPYVRFIEPGGICRSHLPVRYRDYPWGNRRDYRGGQKGKKGHRPAKTGKVRGACGRPSAPAFAAV